MKVLEKALTQEAAEIASRCPVSPGSTCVDFQDRIMACTLELFRTEKTYLSKLRTVNSEFHRRLRAQLSFDESEFPQRCADNFDSMFEFAHGLIDCHEQLLIQMKASAKSSRLIRSLDDVFVKFIGRSREKYIDYALSYPDITNLLIKHQRGNHRFNEFVFVSEICAGESINSLRMAPIQRIPRYKLMLSELLQLCANSPLEATAIQVAINGCHNLMQEIDDSINRGEKIAQVRTVQDVFFEGNINLMDGRRALIKSGELTKLFNRQKAHVFKGKRYKFFLFSDCILYSDVEGKHKCRHVIHLSQMKIIDPDDDSSTIKIISTIKTLSLLPDTHEEKTEWLTALESAIANCDPLPPITTARNFESCIKSSSNQTFKKDRAYSRSFSITLLSQDSSQLRRRSSLPSIWLSPGRIRSLTTALFGTSTSLKPSLAHILSNEA